MRFPHAVLRFGIIGVGVIQRRKSGRQALQLVKQLFKMIPVAGGMVQLAGENPAIFLAQCLGGDLPRAT